MAAPLGDSFAPTFENAELARRGGVSGQFPQGSIKVLNFALPSVAGAAGIPGSISPLVGDHPSGGFGAAVLQSVLHTVLGPGAAASLTGNNDSSYADFLRHERDLTRQDTGGDRRDDPSTPSQPFPLPAPAAPRVGDAPSTPFPDDRPSPPSSPGDTTVHIGGGPTPVPGSDAPSSSSTVGPDFGGTSPSAAYFAGRERKGIDGY